MKKLLGITGICLWAILAGGCRQDSSSGRFEEPEEIVTDFVSEYEIAEVSKSMAVTAIDGSKSRATEMIWTNWPVLKN